jgi:hypothetical protein
MQLEEALVIVCHRGIGELKEAVRDECRGAEIAARNEPGPLSASVVTTFVSAARSHPAGCNLPA